jgi:hypothetical protein
VGSAAAAREPVMRKIIATAALVIAAALGAGA